MKVVILAGGYGTRLSEETEAKPKPMVEIGGKPILWHIMKMYAHHGFNEFIICLGYKGYMIKEYFANYFLHQSDVTFDLQHNTMQIHHSHAEPWQVTLVDTGIDTLNGSRLKRVERYLDKGTFMMTYGDGLADVDIRALVKFHAAHGRLATVTAVQPGGRFGAMHVGSGERVDSFEEKPRGDGGWINGGFFVLEPAALDYIENYDTIMWERRPMEQLAADGQLVACKHAGFWRCMDTLRDKNELEALWKSGAASWAVWK